MAMAFAGQPIAVPVTEIPSPAVSDSSLSTQQGPEPAQQNTHSPVQTRSRSRARRSPDRLPLRTAFKNFSACVEILVGDDTEKGRGQTKYLVHKELLTSASPFFAAALNSTFAEGMEQVVRLPEEKPDSFEWFLQWLYTGSLTTPHNTPLDAHWGFVGHPPFDHPLHNNYVRLQSEAMARSDGDLRNHQGSPKYFLLIDLYALSDRLLTVPLSNLILSTIARLSEATNSVPTPSDTWLLYDNIRDNSSLRTLILDLFAYKKTDKLLETHKDEWHPKFLRELVVKLKRPGPEAIERHSLVAWRPRSWSSTKACVHHYDTAEEVPFEISKYWHQRYEIFSKYDDGIWMTDDAWFGVTPEPVARQIAEDLSTAPKSKTVLIDCFAGAGGNAIAFALSGRWNQIFAIEKDPKVLACAKHNAEVYGVAKKIWWIEGDAFEALRKRLKGQAKNAVVFGSPPWGGPTYTDFEVFDLKVMQPYSMQQLHDAFTAVSKDTVLYLPRTSDLRQVAKYVKKGDKLKVTHYCMHGASKAICVFFGDFEAT
ncbi:RNA methylase family protein [Hortaea werneckii]|nr:RNA methylase family protein [Hortaea werneckii]